MNRVDNIISFANKKEMELTKKREDSLTKIEMYKEHIRTLKPSIDELLKVGNACLRYGIPLESGFSQQEYKTHQFISNGWSHLTGFIRESNNKPFTKVGKIGGGACNYNLITDGEIINVSGEVEYVLRRFLEDFDTFETEFYKYVDNVTT